MPILPFLAEAYVHDLNPVLISLPGGLEVRYYGLSYLAGFLLAWLGLKWLAKTNRIAIPSEFIVDLMFYCIFGVLLGGRLGYLFFYDLPRSLADGATPLLWSFTGELPYWGVFALNKGGMSAHGGFVGLMVGGWLFARRSGVLWRHVMDCVTFAGTPGLFLGRITNFINGELWGKPLPADAQGADAPWWSVQYPAEILIIARDDPQRLLAATEIPSALQIPRADWAVHVTQYPANDESRRVVEGWVERIITQVRAGNEGLIDALRETLTAYYPSQLIQSLAEGVVLVAVLVIIWLKPRKPGVIGASFLIVYGILRILTEFYRQPDEGVAVVLGLQRGQLLSALMIASGILVLMWVQTRKDAPKMGGLLKPAERVGTRE